MYYGNEDKSEEQSKAELYVHIINNDAIISNDEVISDILLLLPDPQLNDKFLELRDYIIRSEILSRLDKWIFEGSISINREEKDFYDALSNLEICAKNFKDQGLKQEILVKVDSLRELLIKNVILIKHDSNIKPEVEIDQLKQIATTVNSLDINNARKAISEMLVTKNEHRKESIDDIQL